MLHVIQYATISTYNDLSEGILAKNAQKLSRRKQGAYFILSSPMMQQITRTLSARC